MAEPDPQACFGDFDAQYVDFGSAVHASFELKFQVTAMSVAPASGPQMADPEPQSSLGDLDARCEFKSAASVIQVSSQLRLWEHSSVLSRIPCDGVSLKGHTDG